jgi:hypothetical protein
MITAYVSQNQGDWDHHLPLLTAAYRSSEQCTTQFTPNMLMLGREVALPIHLLFGMPDPGEDPPWYTDYVVKLQDKMNQAFALVRQHFKSAQRTQKEAYDTRVACNSYEEGDAVFTRNDTKTIGKCPKLRTDPWKGPYIVTRKFSSILLEVRGHPKSKPRILHHDRLKPFPAGALPGWARKLQQDHKKAEVLRTERCEQGVQTEVCMGTADPLESHNSHQHLNQPSEPVGWKPLNREVLPGDLVPRQVKSRQPRKRKKGEEKRRRRTEAAPQQPDQGQPGRRTVWQPPMSEGNSRKRGSIVPRRRGHRTRQQTERFGCGLPSSVLDELE